MAQEQQFSKYNDLEGRFTIDYPSDWYVNEEPGDDKEKVVQFDSFAGHGRKCRHNKTQCSYSDQ